MAGLKPNDFHWIIEGKLAVSECIGGGGLTPRKIRREEEIQWLKGQGINAIFSLLDSDFNLKNYQEVGFRTYHYPLSDDIPKESLNVIFDAIKVALSGSLLNDDILLISDSHPSNVSYIGAISFKLFIKQL